MNPVFSIIICSVNALKFTEVSECYKEVLAGFPFEIIGIHDAPSLAEGYNRGIRRARGDLLIFSHDDILILDPDFGQKIQQRLQHFDILGLAGTDRVVGKHWWDANVPHLYGVIAHAFDRALHVSQWNVDAWPVAGNIQAVDGLCIMARRQTAKEIGFDEVTFDGFHLYDLDFSFRAWHAGKKLGVCCDMPVVHKSVGTYDDSHALYGRRFIEKHCLPTLSKTNKPGGVPNLVSSHNVLLAMWRKEVFQRACIAFQRRKAASLHQI